MLLKKMFRDIKFNKSQFVTIFLMVFLGVFIYSGIRTYMAGMRDAADSYYERNNLQDIWVSGENFTNEDLDKIKSLNNVNDAERKLTIVTTINSDEDLTLQLNFIESNNISKFYVVEGEEFSKDKSGLWIDSYFAENKGYKIGDTLTLKYDGIDIEEEIVGLIMVPDHVYDVKSEAQIFPTHKDYGFGYVSINEFPESYIKKEIMKEANIEDENLFDIMFPSFNKNDYLVFNSVMVDVKDLEQIEDTKLDIENNITNALAVTDRDDSISVQCYYDEIEEGETYVGIFSGMFLFIAILSVITTMSRIVKKQRTEIGTLKALGFKNSKITKLYVSYGFWISLIASILGLIIGPLTLGMLFLRMEMSYFEIPEYNIVIPLKSVIVAIVTIIIISIVTYLSCRSELKEKAAEILRMKTPKVGKVTRFNGKILSKASFSVKWNLRDMFRSKARTIMGIIGILCCCALLVCAFGMLDTMNSYLDWQFEDLYNFKYKLSLSNNYTNEQFKDIIEKYGDNTSQTLAIEVKNGEQKETNTITIDDSNGLLRYTDKNRDFMELSDDGVIITRNLSESLGLSIGDEIKWHVFGDDTWYSSKIVALNRDPQSQSLYTTKEYIESIGITYKPDSVYTNENLSNINEISGVELIQNLSDIRSGMESMLNTMMSMIAIIIVAAAVLGSVIIYNLGILSFSEKTYQFATLKVLGFQTKQIRNIFIKQNNWITIISIVLGLPFGFYMTDFIFKMALSDKYDFSAYIKPISYILATVGTFLVSYFVNKLLSRKVKKIDMVTSLKGNE